MPRHKKQAEGSAFGERLKTLRVNRGITQDQLAQMIGLKQRVISFYERSGRTPPLERLLAIAKALHVSLDEIAGEKPIAEKETHTKIRTLKRLGVVEKFNRQDQKAILDHIKVIARTYPNLQAFVGGAT